MTQIIDLSFDNLPIRVQKIDEVIWFVAKDVCNILELKNSRQAISTLPKSEKGVTINDTPGGAQEMTMVNEPGFYRLVFKSRVPAAEKFKTWVFKEVLPSLRLYGFYGTMSLEDKIQAYQEMRKFTGADRMEAELIRIHKTNQEILEDLKDIAKERGLPHD